MTGSMTLNGMQRLLVPARWAIFSSKPMKTTTSFGATICTRCGLLSVSRSLKVTDTRLDHTSLRQVNARSMMRPTSRSSITVSGRCGMNASSSASGRTGWHWFDRYVCCAAIARWSSLAASSRVTPCVVQHDACRASAHGPWPTCCSRTPACAVGKWSSPCFGPATSCMD